PTCIASGRSIPTAATRPRADPEQEGPRHFQRWQRGPEKYLDTRGSRSMSLESRARRAEWVGASRARPRGDPTLASLREMGSLRPVLAERERSCTILTLGTDEDPQCPDS